MGEFFLDFSIFMPTKMIFVFYSATARKLQKYLIDSGEILKKHERQLIKFDKKITQVRKLMTKSNNSDGVKSSPKTKEFLTEAYEEIENLKDKIIKAQGDIGKV